MIFYNKAIFKKAGIDPENPPLSTYDDFLATSKKIVDSGAADAAIWPSPASEFFQSWFDFYPLYAAQTGGTALVEDEQATFDDENGQAVADFWSQMYADGLSPKEAYTGDAFAEAKSAMAIVGPWAIAVYGEDIDWGVAPVPTQDGTDPAETYTFSDAKNVAVYSACENQKTAWEVLKFATSRGAGRQAPGDHRPDADPRRPRADLPRLLQVAPGVHRVRRPGLAHRRGAERAQLGRDLAGVP